MSYLQGEMDPHFKIFHELMAWKVRKILLVSRPYDAWIMEKDQPLAERIIHEYRGLNLSHPPRINWVPSAARALEELDRQEFDLVITMPGLVDMDAFLLGPEIKKRMPDLPVVLLSHTPLPTREYFLEGGPEGIDYAFVWTGNPDILVAMIKNVEDRMNVGTDTSVAGIRVILLVEDSPTYISSLLPLLYREVVLQTQEVIEHGLTEEQRLLAMRARPKILLAQSYEEALDLFHKYEPCILGVISDVRYPRGSQPDPDAGIDLLTRIHKERFDIPLLLISSEPENAEKAKAVPALFVDKGSAALQSQVSSFVKTKLGFGDFIFTTPDGRQVARAHDLKAFESALLTIPDESFHHHCRLNDFSRWLFARTEIELASSIRSLTDHDFLSTGSHRQYLVEHIQATRRKRRRGAIVNFDPAELDAFTEFAKIGFGSIGGKARGLGFFSAMLNYSPQIREKYPGVDIYVPQTLVLTTEAFDHFVSSNDLRAVARAELSDDEIAERFMAAEVPRWIENQLKAYLEQVKHPLAVRSSSLLEDAQFRAYAGLYKTYMLPNDNSDLACRLDHLLSAVKLVYASTYYRGPRDFSLRVGNSIDEEKMAVIIQKVCGSDYGGYFYPAISGVAQSTNYYPFGKMKPEDGVAVIALGLGKTVVEGGKAIRFSPRSPELALQIGRIEELLDNAQRDFFALRLGGSCARLGAQDAITLARRDVHDARDEHAVRLVTSSYSHEEHRLRDGAAPGGYPVVTFAQVLKHGLLPLGEIISDLLALGMEGMGCPVEIELSVNIPPSPGSRPEFAVLQLRPMTAREEVREVDISREEMEKAFLTSRKTLGNCVSRTMEDIVFVDPQDFALEATVQIAREIGEINKDLLAEARKYLLIGPGRWGSADRWLGIPVQWQDISGVGAMVEVQMEALEAEPSQGSHFFHNITTLGINYIMVGRGDGEHLDWDFLQRLPVVKRTSHVRHVRLDGPMTLKADGRSGRCAVLPGKPQEGQAQG